jgi:2-amino-4-hydroxy-6-hydroxymethyldihydropteridine diphosphokinase
MIGMRKQPIQIYLVLGSNLGDRLAHLKQAIGSLSSKINDMVVSPVYETTPWGVKEQPMFLNLCIGGFTRLSPKELLKFIKIVEQKLQRIEQFKWGPREIDIDILFYGHRVIHQTDLVIPHQHLADRAFALVPLADIAPDLIHPELKYSVKQMLLSVDTSTVKAYRVP